MWSTIEDYKNLSRLFTGTGKSIRVSKICSPQRCLPSRGRCKSLTRGWISLSLYKVVVDYFSPIAFNPHDETQFSLSKTTSKRFLVRKRRQLGLIMTSRNRRFMTSQGVHSSAARVTDIAVFTEVGKELGKYSIVKSTGNPGQALSEVGEKRIFN